MKSEELIRESTNSGLPEEIQELKYRIDQLQKEDPWYVVRGHDLMELLLIGLQHVLGDIGPGTKTEDLARLLIAAMHPEDLRKTNMWTDIRGWESSNPPYEILAD